MRADLIHPGYMPLRDGDYDDPGVGGNESSLILVARHLAARGHDVRVFADCAAEVAHGVHWHPLHSYRPAEERDAAVFWVNTGRLDPATVNAPVRAVKLGGRRAPEGLLRDVQRGAVNLLVAVSEHLRSLFCTRFGYRPDFPWLVTSDGVDGRAYARQVAKTPGKCLHTAVPYRGIDHLLDFWPAIRGAVPYAELWVTSSYLLWGASPAENHARAGGLYERMERMAGLGVHNLVRVPKAALVSHQLESELYVYPTDYEEMCCIAALEAAAAGNAVVASRKAALVERVLDGQTGYLIEGSPAQVATRDAFVDRTVALLRDDRLRRRMQHAAAAFALRESYDRLLGRWEQAIERVAAGAGGGPAHLVGAPAQTRSER